MNRTTKFKIVELSRGKRSSLIAIFVFTFLMSLSLCIACGKRKAPIPPQERVAQNVESLAFQRGDQVILSWKMPARNAPEGDVQNIDRIDVYRLAEPVSSTATLSEEEFASRSIVVASIKVNDDDFGLKTMNYVDQLQYSSQPIRLRYSVRLVNESGQRAAFSNFLLIEPTGSIAQNPDLFTTSITQDAISLTWIAPKENINGTMPPNISGYNIYRAEDKASPAKLLNAEPEQNLTYQDKFFEFDKTYYYYIRSVSVGPNGNKLESSESQIIEVKPKDIFPPSAPSAITIAASSSDISLFFAVNPENDVIGYKIFRSTDPSIEKDKWQLLTTELIKTNTFRDDDTRPGITYYYFITATDKSGNVSENSEIVSETIR